MRQEQEPHLERKCGDVPGVGPVPIRDALGGDGPVLGLEGDRGRGQLVQLGAERGRSTRPGLKLGVCGEHGGDPASVRFFARVGLDYVSCSPYRVPLARLAAAQAAVAGEGDA